MLFGSLLVGVPGSERGGGQMGTAVKMENKITTLVPHVSLALS